MISSPPSPYTRLPSPRRIALVGARGYVGRELIALVTDHPELELVLASSRELAGTPVRDVAPTYPGALTFTQLSPRDIAMEALDAVVLALPNGKSAPFVTALDEVSPRTLVIDLSADHRFSAGWAYGLPERNRTQVRSSHRIANPGCYATGIQLGLHPVLDMLRGPPSVFGVSGYSGAGTTPSPKNDPERLRENLLAYGLTGHIHEQEVTRHLAHPVHFLPHVASWFRGIHLTIDCRLQPEKLPPAWREAGDERSEVIARFFQDAYAAEPLVTPQPAAPLVRAIQGQHHVEVGGFSFSPEQNRLAFCVTIDNLLKGAATQALQNLNLALGLEEYRGIPYRTAPHAESIT